MLELEVTGEVAGRQIQRYWGDGSFCKVLPGKHVELSVIPGTL